MSDEPEEMKFPFSVYDLFAYLSTGFILIAAYDYAFNLGWLGLKELPPGMIALAIVGAYILGHAVAHLASLVLEQCVVRRVLLSPEETLFGIRPSWKNAWLLTWIFWNHYSAFPVETQRRILDRAKRSGIEKPGRALFFHCFPMVKREPSANARLNNFLNVYGFCRNSCFAAILSVPIFLWGAVDTEDWSKVKMAGLAFIVAVVLFFRYLKFFRHHTEEVFRDYAERTQPAP